MIKKLLTVNPQKRITVQEALEHPWMQDKDVVNKADLLMGSLDVESALKTVKVECYYLNFQWPIMYCFYTSHYTVYYSRCHDCKCML